MRWKSKVSRTWIMLLALVPFVLVLAAMQGDAKTKGDGWLGVYIQNIDGDLMDSEDLPSTDGVLVTDVVKDSPAEKAGLERGDVILMFDGKDVRSARRLTRMIEWAEPDEEKGLVILRDGDKRNVVVTIGEDESDYNFSFFGDGDFHVEAPEPPSPPKAYTFSLGQISTSRIGVALYELSDQLAEHYGAKHGGALINEVMEDSPAEKAGLRAGDVIVRMDGNEVEDVDDIRDAIEDKEEGETIAVSVLRDGSEMTIDCGVEESNTWSGVGDWRSQSGWSRHFEPYRWEIRSGQREARDAIREALRESRGGMNEWRDELQDAVKELRKELRDLKKELKEKGF
jgi:membrane-associated protease RseP (regulator of RpoE activity)